MTASDLTQRAELQLCDDDEWRDEGKRPGADSWGTALRVLFLVSAHNGLSQRALLELSERGHAVTVVVVDSAGEMEAAVAEHDPELIVCPFLKTLIPSAIWSAYPCLVVHPGPRGDRGPSSLDWAIELDRRQWGVTVLQANAEADAGLVWATRNFAMRAVGKSSLYRHEVRRAAMAALVEAIDRIVHDRGLPVAADELRAPRGRARPLMRQDIRAIRWETDQTETVARKIRAAEGHPGVLDTIDGVAFHLFGVHSEPILRGRPGEIIAQRTGAICRATVDGAVWITHLQQHETPGNQSCKLPATRALALAGQPCGARESAISPIAPASEAGYREIGYTEHGPVGYLQFEFYNGAMSTEQCERLREAYIYARSQRHTGVIVLEGGSDYFSNGIHLNVIEAAQDPAHESWRNLNAIDDLVREIIETRSHLVVSALGGDAAAGGVPLALAADHVLARTDIVLNPYYRHMGGLYGSEYWTYLLPNRVGTDMAQRLTSAPFTPIGTGQAVQIGLVDASYGASLSSFRARTRELAEGLAVSEDLGSRLQRKCELRDLDEDLKPLQAYRDEEMRRSHECFFGGDRSYHEARRRFVYKLGPTCAPRPSTRSAFGAV